MSFGSKRALAIGGPLFGLMLGALIIMPLVDRHLSPVTSGVMIGVAGMICLACIALGIWSARRGEARRKAKEQIWINH